MNEENDLLSALDERVRYVVLEVLREQQATTTLNSNDAEAESLRATLQRINAKEFVSIKEAAVLLSCSESHLRNLVSKARKGKAKRPIPFSDLDGVTVFHRMKLLQWATNQETQTQFADKRSCSEALSAINSAHVPASTVFRFTEGSETDVS
jgi:hypothetical protein